MYQDRLNSGPNSQDLHSLAGSDLMLSEPFASDLHRGMKVERSITAFPSKSLLSLGFDLIAVRGIKNETSSL